MEATIEAQVILMMEKLLLTAHAIIAQAIALAITVDMVELDHTITLTKAQIAI